MFADMPEPSQSGAVVYSQSAKERWSKVATVGQQREDRLPLEITVAKWGQIYRLFGASDEKAQDAVFAAVNGYFAVNGCSPSGKYSREIRTADGKSVLASHVIKITGRLEGDIRQFLRGRMKDSYEVLRYTDVVMKDEAAVGAAELNGIPRHCAYLMADWLKDCEFLTSEEQDVYVAVSAKNIRKAKLRAQEGVAGPGKRADLGEPEEGPSVASPPVGPMGGGRATYSSY